MTIGLQSRDKNNNHYHLKHSGPICFACIATQLFLNGGIFFHWWFEFYYDKHVKWWYIFMVNLFSFSWHQGCSRIGNCQGPIVHAVLAAWLVLRNESFSITHVSSSLSKIMNLQGPGKWQIPLLPSYENSMLDLFLYFEVLEKDNCFLWNTIVSRC